MKQGYFVFINQSANLYPHFNQQLGDDLHMHLIDAVWIPLRGWLPWAIGSMLRDSLRRERKEVE